MPKPDIGRKSLFLLQLGGLRRNIAITFGTEKLEWCGYPTVKLLNRFELSTEYTNVTDIQTDRQTDGRTPHDGIGRAYA